MPDAILPSPSDILSQVGTGVESLASWIANACLLSSPACVFEPTVENVPFSGNRPPAPELTGSALDAVRYRGGHLQIIAAAGSGKTEVVSQRVVDLLAEGVPAESIVAFTFTERAAEELSNRIAHRVEDRLVWRH
jgi:UvrD/REP helicase N-terminal domain